MTAKYSGRTFLIAAFVTFSLGAAADEVVDVVRRCANKAAQVLTSPKVVCGLLGTPRQCIVSVAKAAPQGSLDAARGAADKCILENGGVYDEKQAWQKPALVYRLTTGGILLAPWYPGVRDKSKVDLIINGLFH